MAYKQEVVLSTPSRRQIYDTSKVSGGNDVNFISPDRYRCWMKTGDLKTRECLTSTPRVKFDNTTTKINRSRNVTSTTMTRDSILKRMDDIVSDQTHPRQQMFSQFCSEVESLFEKLKISFHNVAEAEAQLQKLLSSQEALLQKFIMLKSRNTLAFQNLFDHYIADYKDLDSKYETNKKELLDDVAKEVEKLMTDILEGCRLSALKNALNAL